MSAVSSIDTNVWARRFLLLVTALAGACETPTVQSGREVVEAPYVETRTETGVGRMSRECEAGKKLSCYLLARAYDKGEAPVTAVGEIVVRNMRRAAYYHDKACALGGMPSCYDLADLYLKGNGVTQNSSKAARLYSTLCRSDRVLDYETGASCASLGKMTIRGDGVAINFRAGVELLQRACRMGNKFGCDLRDIYAGTGLKTSAPPPEGALGFSFGWSKAQAKSACTDQAGRWSEEAQPGKPSIVCELKLVALDRNGRIQLTFIDNRLVSLFAAYDSASADAGKEFARVEKLLTGLYAGPGERIVEVLDGCGSQKLGTCIEQKQATLSAYWQFTDQHTIGLSIDGRPDGEVSVSVMYLTPESMKSVGHPGL